MSAILPSWRHQREAFCFVHDLWATHSNGAMLALAMGTGKTKVAIDLAVDEAAEQLLIVCPLRVVSVWEQQLACFAPNQFHVLALDERVRSVAAKHQEAKQLYEWSQEHKRPVAICINYDSARVNPFGDWAANRPWDMVIADELHRCKEPRGRTSMWLAQVGRVARRRLGLTGTPMPHTPIDIWGQFRFLDPSHLERSYWLFKNRYAIMGGYLQKQIVGWQNLDELEARFRELAFRVDESVLDLPETMDEIRSAGMGKQGARMYREMEREMITWIGEQPDEELVAKNALERLLRLAQITGGSLKVEGGKPLVFDHAKEDLLTELLEDLREPVVVFCRFKPDLEAVHRAAKCTGLGSLELSGTRDEHEDWQKLKPDEPPFVLATQIQAGSEGVDLTRARIAIYFSIDFNLAHYLQSRKRIHRPPQARPCVYYHLQIRNSIDEYILRAVQARHDLVRSILEELKRKAKGAPHVVTD